MCVYADMSERGWSSREKTRGALVGENSVILSLYKPRCVCWCMHVNVGKDAEMAPRQQSGRASPFVQKAVYVPTTFV